MSGKKDKEPQPIGLDLVDARPDYSKTAEENEKEYRERYRVVYGEDPPETTKKQTPKGT